MERNYTITLGELQQRYSAGRKLLLCPRIAELAGVEVNHEVDVIGVFQQHFPRYVSKTMIAPYSHVLDGYIIDPNVRRLPPRILRTRMFEDLVRVYGGDHVLTFTIKW